MEYWVNKRRLGYLSNGPTFRGKDEVLLNQAVDLTANLPWRNNGYTIEPLFEEPLFNEFKRETIKLLKSLWRKSGLEFPESLSVSDYHKIASTQEKHLAAVEFTKLIDVHNFPVSIKLLEARMTEILKCPLIVRNPFDDQSVFHFRVIRPNSGDNNPLHRDVWLPDYKDCINLYIPVAGSNELSSLIIAPGSHHWAESSIERTISGAEIGKAKFNVPAVTNIDTNVEFVRPNPKENEVLIFSPYLIHGGSSNLNPDITRISIEVRLWKK